MRLTRSGFSLVELMIVVAIIGILAAIAIPNYVAMQMKAKRVELNGNVDGIKVAEISYDATYGLYVTTGSYPDPVPGKTPVEWVDADAGSFTVLGWRPDGKVRGQYGVVGGDTDFTVTAQSDIDDDGHYQEVIATTSINATMMNGDTVF